jgi:hypothetical protein
MSRKTLVYNDTPPTSTFFNYAPILQKLPDDYKYPIATTDENGFLVMNKYVDTNNLVKINDRLGNYGDVPSLTTLAADAIVKNMIGKNKDHYIVNTDKVGVKQFVTELNKDLTNNDLPDDIDQRIADVAVLHRMNAEQFNNLPYMNIPLANDDNKLMIDNFKGKSNISQIPHIDKSGILQNKNTIFRPLTSEGKSEVRRKTQRNDYSRFRLYNHIFPKEHPVGNVIDITPDNFRELGYPEEIIGYRIFTFR